MSKELANNFQSILDMDYPELKMEIVELKLWETTNSHATWKKEVVE